MPCFLYACGRVENVWGRRGLISMAVVEGAATTQRVASPDGAAAHESRRRAPVLQENFTTSCGVGRAGCGLVAGRGRSRRRRARCRD
jgi:hypothetical protein